MNASNLPKDFLNQYKRDGYFVVKQLLPASEIERIFSDIHQLVILQLKHLGLGYSKGNTVEDVHRDLQTLFARDTKTYLATLTLFSKLLSLYELYLHENIRASVTALGLTIHVWQTGPILHLMSQALKMPGGYYGFGMHQDWPSQQGGIDGVTVWIPLVDVDRNMYTMELIPGSHKRGLYPATLNEHIQEIDPASYDKNALVPIEAKRGDVVFMSAFMLHRSSTEGDDRLRVATSIRYENAAEPHFIARGYPGAQKRTAMKELITPGFPTEKQLQEVFE